MRTMFHRFHLLHPSANKLSSVTGNSIRPMVRLAENTDLDREAGLNPVIKRELSISTVKGKRLLHPHIHVY